MTDPVTLHGTAGEPAAADREAWIAAGRQMASGRSDASWAFADWLAQGVAAWGKEVAKEAAKITGASPGKISNSLRVATAYPPFRRRNTLGFSHHLEVSRLPEAEAEELLDRAEAEGWSRATLRDVVAEGREAKLDRLQTENVRLRAQVAALKRGPKDARQQAALAAQQFREDLRSDLKALDACNRRIAERIEAAAESPTLAALHGNARLSLRKWLDGALAEAGNKSVAVAEERTLPAAARLARGAEA